MNPQGASVKPEQFENARLLIVGNADVIHVGSHLFNAGTKAGLDVNLCDLSRAFEGSWPVRKIYWWLLGHRPPKLESFSQDIVNTCREFRPRWLLSTGISPISASALDEIRRSGVTLLNFLTDDPWNPAHKTSWFMNALIRYDHVFSPRYANLGDLKTLGCRQVSYLPFAYSPDLHFPDPARSPAEVRQFASDVVFVGGADADRVPYMQALIREGYKVALYGGYWRQFPETKRHSLGHADPHTVRRAIGGGKIALCLVRRSNRDGHAMRTFEVAAIGACMLVEDTSEHREIFGPDNETVSYFASIDELIARTGWLLEHEAERKRLAHAAGELIRNNGNKYEDRLLTMLSVAKTDTAPCEPLSNLKEAARCL